MPRLIQTYAGCHQLLYSRTNFAKLSEPVLSAYFDCAKRTPFYAITDFLL